MRFISDKTGEIYNSIEECDAAERAFDEKERRKKKLEKEKDARKQHINELIKQYIKDYGSFDFSYERKDKNIDDDFYSTFKKFFF